MRNTFYITFLALFAFVLSSCDDDMNVTPGPIKYPIDLKVDASNTSVALEWSEATVSNFEEYIIVRSIDSIPDTPEPDLRDMQQIIERIDQRDVLEFTDFATPLENKVYYKVFAKIGERFLISPTVRADLSFQIIDLRVDGMTVMKDRDIIYGFDRILDVLFKYDYDEGVLEAQNFAFFNNPIMTTGIYNGNPEVYIVDRNSTNVTIFSGESLDQTGQIFTNWGVQDMISVDGYLFVARDNSSIAVYRRQTGTRLAEISTQFSSIKNLQHLTSSNGVTTFIEVLQNQVIKYSWNGATLTRVDQTDAIPGSSQVLSARRPGGDEVVVYNTARIIDADLDASRSVSSDAVFFNTYDFTPDGESFIGSAFEGNQPVLRFYSTKEGDYELERTVPIVGSLFRLFGDNGGAYALTIQFVSGGSRTVISKYATP